MNEQNKNTPSGFAKFFRGLFSWRVIHRALISLACVATLVAVFYTVENWRGKRAWEKCKTELEAKGAVLDWNKYIPPPVPDDQNFFKAPGIDETNWVGRGSRELSDRFAKVQSSLQSQSTNALLLAEVSAVSDAPANQGVAVLRLNEPDVRLQAKKLLEDACGSIAFGGQGFVFASRTMDQIRPVQIVLVSEPVPGSNEISGLFSECFVNHAAYSYQLSHIQIESNGASSFRVLVKNRPVTAADYLKATDSFESDFDVIREALKRPYARIDGDYTVPALIPIPNFITMRVVAQTLAQRTQCALLVGKPDEALRDLTLLHDICRILEAKPTGKPMTLVASMINVAITGLYSETIKDGLRLHAWREPQLIAIQRQLARVSLGSLVHESFLEERVFSIYSMEHTPRSEMVKWFGDEKAPWFKRVQEPRWLFFRFAPRGWFYQNMVAHTKIVGPMADTYDSTKDLFFPSDAVSSNERVLNLRKTPYNFLIWVTVPNFTKAWRTVAHNQTVANEALIACALERYHSAHKEFPETLNALAPEFIEKVPHDVIGGQALHYRHTDDGKFSLYSVGWNEKDDGGEIVLSKDGKEDWENGDWVWQTN